MDADAAFATGGHGHGDGDEFAGFGIQCLCCCGLLECAVGLQHFRVFFTHFAEGFFDQCGVFVPVFKHDLLLMADWLRIGTAFVRLIPI